MEPFPSHHGYQVTHWGGQPSWTAQGSDGTIWFEADSEAELLRMIEEAVAEVPEPVV